MVIKGTASAQVTTTPAMEAVANLVSYSLVNKSGGSLTVTAGVILGSTLILFCSKVLGANDSFQYTGEKIIIEKGYSIYVYTSGASLDYHFSIL